MKYFQDEIATHDGFEVVELCDFMNKDEDFSALLGAVLAQVAGCDFHLRLLRGQGCTDHEAGARAWAMRARSSAATRSTRRSCISIAGDAAVGAVFTTFYDAAQPATEMTSEFLDAYRAKYGKEPAAPTVMAYDAYLTMRNAIETAGTTDAEAVRDASVCNETVSSVPPVPSRLNDTHDAVRPVVFKEVRGGRQHESSRI